jgi:hypothetical protein
MHRRRHWLKRWPSALAGAGQNSNPEQSRLRNGPLVFVTAAAVCAGLPRFAAANSWINPAGGNWSDANNWNPATVPSSLASFGLGSTAPYTVNLTTSVALGQVTLQNDRVRTTGSSST